MRNDTIVPGTNFTVDEAIDWLTFCSDQYHSLGTSPVLDIDYDYVSAATRAVVPEHPFFAGMPDALRTKKQLKNKLYPLNKIQTKQDIKTGACLISATFLELENWLESIKTKLNTKEVVWFITPKYNGLTVVIYYENGYLTSAVTMGDGTEGKDVTEHIKRIDGVPFIIPGNLDAEIRGKVTMRNSKFASYTQNDFKTTRNVTAGTMNLNNHDLVLERGLSFYAQNVLLNNKEFLLSEKEKFTLLRSWKFYDIGELGETVNLDDIKSYFNQLDNARKTVGSDRPIQKDSSLDGIILTVADKRQQQQLGYNAKHPEFATAVKFAPDVAEATITAIDWQLNRHGVFCPIAILNSVLLEGSIVSKAMAGNYARIERDCIGIGTKVLIRQTNATIPHIISVLEKESTYNEAPDECPSCQQQVYKQNADLICLNNNCKAQVIERLYHFASIVIPAKIGITKAFIQAIYDANLARSIPDLYLITKPALIAVDGIGENKASAFVRAIEGSKNITFPTLLQALSIPTLGRMWAEEIACLLENDGSKLIDPVGTTYEGISKILYKKDPSKHTIPINVFSSFCSWLCTPANIQLIQNLLRARIKTLIPELEAENGIKICIAGRTALPRKSFERFLRSKGFIVDKNIDQNTDILICNTPLVYKKTKKALKLGVEIIPEALMLARLEGNMDTIKEAYKKNIDKETAKIIPAEILWQEAINISKIQEQLSIDKKKPNNPN